VLADPDAPLRGKPIIFSSPMVKALLDGRKTQTRRTVKWLDGNLNPKSTYAVGYRLWVREAFVIESDCSYGIMEPLPVDRPVKTLEDGDGCEYHLIPHYRATEPEPHIVSEYQDTDDDRTRWRPSIHMPRWASRLTLNVTEVRVERLQDISEEDALAEGTLEATEVPYIGSMTCDQASDAFRLLWEHIHGPGSWDANPWVCAVSFSVEKRNIDAPLRLSRADGR
jgi:hypothetical protein